jgi:SAM-dependent methyltransferase
MKRSSGSGPVSEERGGPAAGRPPWFESLFETVYLRAWGEALTDERTQREVDGVLECLRPLAGARILDLCCGQGRHSVALAQRAFDVTGYDLSARLLGVARHAAEEARLQVAWVRGDMRELPFREEFDAVVNLFTAFGYFDTQQEDQLVLEGAARALRPGGAFLIDFIHRDGILRAWQPASVFELSDGALVAERRRFDLRSSRLWTEATLIEPDGKRETYGYGTRMYTATELSRMLEHAGLAVVAAWGGLDCSDLSLESRRVVLLGRKPLRGQG